MISLNALFLFALNCGPATRNQSGPPAAGSTETSRVLRLLGAIATATALTACSTPGLLGMGTPYQASGWRGGYKSTELASNRFVVTFTANQYSDPADAADFALLRAAELTLERGFSDFTIVTGKDNVVSTPISIPITQYRSDLGRDVTTGSRMGVISTPMSSLTIVCYKGLPAEAKTQVMDARMIYDRLTSKHGIPKKTF